MRTSSTAGTALLLSGVLLLAGCSDDRTATGPPAAAPLSTVPSASTPPSPSPSSSPSPSPSPSPLSAFEADPAVMALRGYLAAVAKAVNANDLGLPALRDAATAKRAARHQARYGEDLGKFYPAPNPVAVLGVRVVSATKREIPACSLEGGHVLERAGGPPVSARKFVGGTFEMVLEGGRWKLDQAISNAAVDCTAVVPQGRAG